MLRVRVTNDKQNEQFEHTGVLEFGRAPQRGVSRCQLQDIRVSRHHVRLEELPNERVRLENLSTSGPVLLSKGGSIPLGDTVTLDLPVQITLGRTQIDLDPVRPLPRSEPPDEETRQSPPEPEKLPPPADEESSFQALAEPASHSLDKSCRVQQAVLAAGGEAVRDTLAQWLETISALQQAVPDSLEFYRKVAGALAVLIGLDLGLVLLRQPDGWQLAGSYAADDTKSIRYSRTLLDHVAATRTTIYQDISTWKIDTHSLRNLEAVVASPILGLQDDVVGVLYGLRIQGTVERGGIQPLEAQLVQLLAATVGSHLVRSAAQRTRVQFEQFFSPELVRELERNPDLLEGRNQDVTVLFSDLRGFTALSQRLGPQKTCRLLRDVMERLSERIVEHGGTIVDYAGDGILAMWNAPTVQADHAERACHAALDMLDEMPGLNQKCYDLAGGMLSLGIGINTGIAQVGNTGSSRKFKYGPHGHTVNLASRVQEATKKLGLPVLITAATRDLLPPDLAIRRLGRVRLPGVGEPVVLHELHGERVPLEWKIWRDAYEQALTEYEAGQWAKACQTLLPLLQHFENMDHPDAPTLKLLRRAGECLESRPEPFDPIIEVGTK
jgi:adenylate cyclase